MKKGKRKEDKKMWWRIWKEEKIRKKKKRGKKSLKMFMKIEIKEWCLLVKRI